jgi:monoamine oxidase
VGAGRAVHPGAASGRPAPHATFFALYDRPFWRAADLSGTAQSMVGSLVEIHDVTTASGQAALFGFVGVPAEQRAAVGRDAIVAASVQQLAQLFGSEAGMPYVTLFKDWAADPLTATPNDQLAGSETSRTEPGYLTGAVEAVERAVADVMSRLAKSGERTVAAPSEETRR